MAEPLAARGQRIAIVGFTAVVMQRSVANKLRFALGLVIALGLGVYSHFADRGALLTYVLPAAIGLAAIADFIGYLTSSRRGSGS